MSIAGASKTATDESVVYVYGVGRVVSGAGSAPLRLEGIIPQAPVQPVVHGGLAAFVSMVPASQFGATELHAGLADAEWLRERILAHEKTIEELCSSHGAVPFRFCTIFRDAAEVAKVLARHQAELEQTLDRVRGASEWGVKLFYDPAALRRQVETASGAIGNLRKTLIGASPGAQFFLRKKFDKALDAEVASIIAMSVAQSHGCLAARARETAQIKLQTPAEHGRPEVMIMNVACLVDEAAAGEFKRTLAQLRTEFAAQGLVYELTGPWPAYHFVSSGREGLADAAASDQ